MMQGIQYPPKTIMEVFKMLPDGTLAEVIEQNLYMSPAPTTKHQKTSIDIVRAFLKFLDGNPVGELLTSPCDVYLDEHSTVVQPDLIFVLSHNLSIVKTDAIHGVPDLLVEILSPANLKHDTVTKKNLYERVGVKEYWIVDPETKQTIGYFLKDGIYVSLESVPGKLKSVLLNHELSF